MACEAGVDAMQYWDMTLKEITMAIKAYSKRTEMDMRVNAVIAFHQARMISREVGISFGSKQAHQEIYEAFPGIFPQLEQQAAIKGLQQQHHEIMKARIQEYATFISEKRKREEKLKQSEVNQQDGNDD